MFSLLVFFKISFVYFVRVLGESLSLSISLFGVFSDSLRFAVGQRSVSVLSCFSFPPFIFFKEKRRKLFKFFFL
jgi:hypothetical protein